MSNAAPRMRPRFRMDLPFTQENALERINEAFDGCETCCTGTIVQHHVNLTVIEEERHFWSPHIHLLVEEEAEKTIVRGLIGPNPHVWTMFMAGYASLAFGGLFAAGLGFAQVQVKGSSPWGFYILPFLLVAAMFLYAFSFVGQRLAFEQVHELLKFIAGAWEQNPPPLDGILHAEEAKKSK